MLERAILGKWLRWKKECFQEWVQEYMEGNGDNGSLITLRERNLEIKLCSIVKENDGEVFLFFFFKVSAHKEEDSNGKRPN